MPRIFFPVFGMRKGEDAEKAPYQCNACKQMFFSYSEVAYHKGMTGHGQFTKKEKRTADDG
jgi:hypothetical protein